jgi:hypothetical protein
MGGRPLLARVITSCEKVPDLTLPAKALHRKRTRDPVTVGGR